MKLIAKIRSMTIFPKLVLGFLLAIVPMYVAGLFMNEWGSQSVKKEISQSLHSRSNFFMRTFEQEIRGTVLLMKEMTLDDDLQKLSTIAPAMSRLENFQAIGRMQSKMRMLQNSNQYIVLAQTYIPLIDKTIQGTSYVTAMTEEQLDALKQWSKEVIFQWNGMLQLGEIYPDFVRENKQPNFAMNVELSVSKMESALQQLASGSGGALLQGMGQEWSVFHENGDEIRSIILEQIGTEIWSDERESFNTQMKINGKTYWISLEKSEFLNAVLVVYSPEEEFMGPLGKYRLIFFGLSALSLIVVIVFSYWIYNRIHQPLRLIVKAFRKLNSSNLQLSLQHNHKDEFQYLYDQFNAMVKRLQVLIHEVYEQKIRSQRSELKQLQSQINPHFLYNSFFTLQQMAEIHDFDNIMRFTNHLGNYFRFITRNASDAVTLEAEVDHAKAYAVIQSIRFSNRISVRWEELAEEDKPMEVPILFLQPLIENAYTHGMEDKEAGGRIEVRMLSGSDRLQIIVEDNGESLTDAQLSKLQERLEQPDEVEEVTGLFNVHRRLQLKFGGCAGISLSRGEMGGLHIQVTLPKEGDELHASVADRR